MTHSEKQLKTITKLLNAYIFASFKENEFDFDYEQPYENLVNEMVKVPEIAEYFDDDIFHWIIERQVTKRMEKPKNLEPEEVTEVLETVRKDLLMNIGDHVIIVPVPKADFSDLIVFGNHMLIPHTLKRKEKISHIAKFSRKKLADATSILEHTENSRSPDFLKYPLLCIKEKQQSTTVHFKALNISRLTIYAITTYYYANIVQDHPVFYHALASLVRTRYPASHLAILSKDKWRERHKPLNFDPTMRFNLNWLAEKSHQVKLLLFIRGLILAESRDQLRILFLNALILLNEAMTQNASIATLMTMTAAESLLTQKRNEKRLRLAAILPRLVKVKDISLPELSVIFTELYLKRNDFVHAGKTITIMYSDRKAKDSLEVAKIAVASLLLQYPAIERRLTKQVTAEGKAGTKDILLSAWQREIDTIFENMISGVTK